MLARALLIRVVRCEHRSLLTALIRLTIALAERDPARLRKELRAVTSLLGNQFRYEEVALFPALMAMLDSESIEELLVSHDRVIKSIDLLAALAMGNAIADEQVHAGAAAVWQVMESQYASERLTMLMRDLSEDAAMSVIAARGTAMDESIDLTTWATTMRKRRGSTAEGRGGQIPSPG